MHPELQALLNAEDGEIHARAEALSRALERLPPPQAPDSLLERFVALGIARRGAVVDLGCGHGQYARQIASAMGATVVAMDAALPCVAETASGARAAREQRVRVLRALAEAVPLRSSSVASIWCRDMLNHVELPRAMRECARVLSPGGWMLVYQTFATDLLEPREAERIYSAFAIVPENMDPRYFERCAAGAGFSVVERNVIGGAWREWWEADGSRKTSDAVLRAARMLRAGDALRRQFGEATYEFAFADQLWGVYQMIGKLEPTAYLLRRE